MPKEKFKQAVSRSDERLNNPQIAVFVIPTEFGPIVPIIKRRKYFKDKQGKPIPDENGKALFEQWFDLPGGKADPIYDPVSLIKERQRIEELKKKHPKTKQKPEDNARIIDVEPAYQAALRETDEETGLYVTVTNEIARAPHPVKMGLKRVFHAAVYCGGRMKNMVPNEHDYVIPTDPENAIALLGDRIPDEVRNFIRQQAEQITQSLAKADVIDLKMYRDEQFTETMKKLGHQSLIAA